MSDLRLSDVPKLLDLPRKTEAIGREIRAVLGITDVGRSDPARITAKLHTAPAPKRAAKPPKRKRAKGVTIGKVIAYVRKHGPGMPQTMADGIYGHVGDSVKRRSRLDNAISRTDGVIVRLDDGRISAKAKPGPKAKK